MNLGKQIHTLLKRQPSVYVKGLGTFRRNHQSASFDAKRNVFLPPITYIEFEGDSSDGFSFVSYIQQIHQIDRLQAEATVDTAVNALKNQMQQHGEAILDSLGHIVIYGNSYVFKPLDLSGFQYSPVNDDYAKSSSEIAIPSTDSNVEKPISENIEIADSSVTETVAEEEVSSDNLKVEVEEIQQSFPTVEIEESTLPPIPIIEESTNEKEPEEALSPTFAHVEEVKESNSLLYIIVAILALITLGGLYFYNQSSQEQVSDEQVSPSPVLVDSIPSIDTNLHALDTSAMLTDSIAIVDTLATEVPIIEEVIRKYTIIIGTHKTLEDATRDAEAYHKKGHKSVKVLTPNLSKNNKRVVWDTYATKEERDSALTYVRKNIKADAWPDIVR